MFCYTFSLRRPSLMNIKILKTYIKVVGAVLKFTFSFSFWSLEKHLMWPFHGVNIVGTKIYTPLYEYKFRCFSSAAFFATEIYIKIGSVFTLIK